MMKQVNAKRKNPFLKYILFIVLIIIFVAFAVLISNQREVAPEESAASVPPKGNLLVDRILFTKDIGGGNYAIHSMDPNGENVRQLSSTIKGESIYDHYAKFSPDGSRLVFARRNEEGRYDMWTVGVDGKDQKLVKRFPSTQGSIWFDYFYLDAQENFPVILYKDNGRLFLVDGHLNESDPVSTEILLQDNIDPFMYPASYNHEIYIGLDRDGGGYKDIYKLYDFEYGDNGVDFKEMKIGGQAGWNNYSPKVCGGYIFFTCHPDSYTQIDVLGESEYYEKNEICKMNMDGTNVIRLTDNDRRGFVRACSPDDKKIAFITNDPNRKSERKFEIRTMDVDAVQLNDGEKLTNNLFAEVVSDWQNVAKINDPINQERILFTRNIGDNMYAIHTMNSDGTGINPISFSIGGERIDDHYAKISSQKKDIVFARSVVDDTGTNLYDIWAITVEGQGQRLIKELKTKKIWLSFVSYNNKEYLLYLCDDGLFLMDYANPNDIYTIDGIGDNFATPVGVDGENGIIYISKTNTSGYRDLYKLEILSLDNGIVNFNEILLGGKENSSDRSPVPCGDYIYFICNETSLVGIESSDFIYQDEICRISKDGDPQSLEQLTNDNYSQRPRACSPNGSQIGYIYQKTDEMGIGYMNNSSKEHIQIRGNLGLERRVLSDWFSLSNEPEPLLNPNVEMTADLNGDGMVNIQDFKLFVQHYKQGDNPKIDYNQNGIYHLDIGDFLVFAKLYRQEESS